ncbi:hypothetical protein ADL22_07930 [Streptomyces sp. NRRL F-4489]|uniref:hypothetical protein n=1 Tax=Streptomyces sp. NRRL F-4489 TaxID=1609095 RepID=UPI000746D2DB|nr:hypothetical protein [Streptomyces sp. NRRL F-4489]KUL49623.1 hypothetical protein ADL22_07930 [Streptomyces sp. NRRL F-4489]
MTSLSAPGPARPPDDAPDPLVRYAAERATGALRGPDGCVYLHQGAVYCVECPAAPGPGARLAAAGRLPAECWHHAEEAAGADRRGGQFLVGRGWLSRGELELCQLTAMLDAACFVLPPAPGGVAFAPGEAHWLGVVRPVGAGALLAAVARRRAQLDRLGAWAAADGAPVVPVPPEEAGRRPLTGRQRRLLAHADGRRTPGQLALALGQSAFLTVLEVRRLAAAGRVRLPAPAALPRRRPGAFRDGRPAADAPVGPAVWRLPDPGVLTTADPDTALLVRLRTALEENL